MVQQQRIKHKYKKWRYIIKLLKYQMIQLKNKKMMNKNQSKVHKSRKSNKNKDKQFNNKTLLKYPDHKRFMEYFQSKRY